MKLAPGVILEPAPDLRVSDHGSTLIGGSPMRILRLSQSGAVRVGNWFNGEAVGNGQAERQLAWRLIDSGLATIAPKPIPSRPQAKPLTVVIPVKDDVEGLSTTLKALGQSLEGVLGAGDVENRRWLSIIVVDDGSSIPIPETTLERTQTHSQPWSSVRILRRPTNGGPAAARNLGLSQVTTDSVAFIDANVVVSAQQLLALASELEEANTVAVAPRVRPFGPAETTLERYESRWSALDMGPRSGLVGVGRPVPYVPTACLVADTAAVRSLGGFDQDLRFGEDVDLVWRLADTGWVRYLPSISVHHPARSSLSAFARQRFQYGSAAAPLANRHGSALAPARLTSTMTATLSGVLLRSRFVAGTSLVASAVVTRQRIKHLPQSSVEAARLTGSGLRHSWASSAVATARSWWPGLAVMALCWPRSRAGIVLLAGTGLMRRSRGGRPLEAATNVALGAVDDVSYSAGVWQGALKHRSLRALLPSIKGFGRSSATGR